MYSAVKVVQHSSTATKRHTSLPHSIPLGPESAKRRLRPFISRFLFSSVSLVSRVFARVASTLVGLKESYPKLHVMALVGRHFLPTALVAAAAGVLTSSRLSSPSISAIRKLVALLLVLNAGALPFVWHIGKSRSKRVPLWREQTLQQSAEATDVAA